MHKIRFPLELRPRPRWASLQRSPDLAVFKKGSGADGERGRGRRRGGKGEKGKRRETGGKGRGQAPRHFGLEPPLLITYKTSLRSASYVGCQCDAARVCC